MIVLHVTALDLSFSISPLGIPTLAKPNPVPHVAPFGKHVNSRPSLA